MPSSNKDWEYTMIKWHMYGQEVIQSFAYEDKAEQYIKERLEQDPEVYDISTYKQVMNRDEVNKQFEPLHTKGKKKGQEV